MLHYKTGSESIWERFLLPCFCKSSQMQIILCTKKTQITTIEIYSIYTTIVLNGSYLTSFKTSNESNNQRLRSAGRQRSKVKTLLLHRCASVLCVSFTCGKVKTRVISTSDRTSKRAWSNCVPCIGVRAGGGRGGLQPPQILANSNFLGQHEKIWAKPVFKGVCMFLLLFWRNKYFLF